jgi:uncharacterized protein (DUF1778 family)
MTTMRPQPKNAQLQIRVSEAEKSAVQRAAKRAGMGMSEFVLSRILSVPADRFQESTAACAAEDSPSYALAELNSLLSAFTRSEMRDATSIQPAATLTPFVANYVAAMIEYACNRYSIPSPAWTRSILPLEKPYFGSALQSLRLHLLVHSPAPFRRRNIFIDSTLGDRI